MKKKLFTKNNLDEFKNIIKKIKGDKDIIEQKINEILQELEEKIKFIKNLKNKFLENLKMKIQFVELLLNNYEKKLEDFDINYFIINNLENQKNFNLEELKINKNDSLDKKIEYITDYLNKNLNSQFRGNYIKSVDYTNIKSYKYKLINFLDLNSYLLVLYTEDKILFISKNNYEIKFQLKEYDLKEIKICNKINDKKILINTTKNIIIIDIIDNIDYRINKKISFLYNIHDFNTNLDLLCFDNDKFYDKYRDDEAFSIRLFSFNSFDKSKFLITFRKTGNYNDNKLQFCNNNIFFRFSQNNLESYIITKDKCSLKNSLDIEIDSKDTSIIDLNNEFYCLNDQKKILLLNKNDLSIAKTINNNCYNLGMLKISDKIITVFLLEGGKLIANNYDIFSNGINWRKNHAKQLLDKTVSNFFFNNNYILFTKGPRFYDDKTENECFLFKIEVKNK